MKKRKRKKKEAKQAQSHQNKVVAKFPKHPNDVFLSVDFSKFDAVYKPTSYTDFGLARAFVLTFNLSAKPGKNGDYSSNLTELPVNQSIDKDVLGQYFGLYVEYLISCGLSKSKLEEYLAWNVHGFNLMYCVKSFVTSKQTQQNLKGN